MVVEVHCERCGTGYALDEARLGGSGGRVRCARCGHVFVVQRPSTDAPAPPAPAAEGVRRDWRVRRRDGSISSLRELTTLQRWIVEGKLSREDEVGLDGQNWRPLGTISDLAAFFSAADALSRVAALDAELARSRAAAARPAAEAPRTPLLAEVPHPAEPPRLTPLPLTPPGQPPTTEAPERPASPQRRPPPRLHPGAEEPAFTRSSAGLGVTPTDDWEPPKLRRGPGVWLLVLLLVLAVAAASAWAYFNVWLPEAQRAQKEAERNSQLEREQAEHEARLKAAEQRAKQELLQSLAAAAAQDAGPPAPPDAGPPPQGALEAPPQTAPLAVTPPGPLAAPTLPTSAVSPRESPGTPPPPVVHASPQTFEEWMVEATRLRTHERAAGALAAYEKALDLRPQSAEAHTGRGLALLDLGRRHQAILEFHRTLELDPRDGVAVLGLAETYRSLGRVEEARGAYQRYLDGWPGGSEARAARAALESLKE